MCARSAVNQEARLVVDYVRWVMVRKKDPDAPAPETVVPDLPEAVDAGELVNPFQLNRALYDTVLFRQSTFMGRLCGRRTNRPR